MPRWSRFLIGALVVAGITAAVVEFVPRPVAAPAPGADAALEQRLAGHVSLFPTGTRVMTWVFSYPESPNERGTMILALDADGTLPTAGLVDTPAKVLTRSGRFLTVEDASGFVFIAPLSDPRIVIGEEWDGRRFSRGTVETPEGGTSSLRIPFAPGGRLSVFEVSGGRISRVFLDFTMPDSPYPARGRRFTVRFS